MVDGIEECANCAYWERRGGGWGRCWAPDSNGDELGLVLIGDAVMLTTHGSFSCSAWTPSVDEGDDDEYGDTGGY